MADFIAMGGYAAYVWPCFVITLVALVANLLLPLARRRRLIREIAMERLQTPTVSPQTSEPRA